MASVALTDDEVTRALAKQQGWRRVGEALVRELIFPDFDAAMDFFERVARAAVDYGRRPDMCVYEFNHVRLRIANPNHAGFTQAEMRLAEKVNAIIGRHHPGAAQGR
jgi:pterin-4a-carbinolamine dehydratase